MARQHAGRHAELLSCIRRRRTSQSIWCRAEKDYQRSCARDRIRITGFVAPELYRRYLSLADAAVQLRTLSRGETSGTVLDCRRREAVIVNAHGSAAELPNDCVCMLPEHFSNAELTAVIEKLPMPIENAEKLLDARLRAYVREKLSPRKIADQYYSAIEWQSTYSQNALTQRAAAELVAMELKNDNEADWLAIARAMN